MLGNFNRKKTQCFSFTSERIQFKDQGTRISADDHGIDQNTDAEIPLKGNNYRNTLLVVRS